MEHLTPQKIEKRVTYAELKTLAVAVATMGECMEPLAGGVPIRVDEIKEWSIVNNQRRRLILQNAASRSSNARFRSTPQR